MKSRNGTASGISGYRVGHLKALLAYNIAEHLARVLSIIILGKCSSEVEDTLTAGLCTPIWKNAEQTAVRPIVVFETFLRMASKAIATDVTSSFQTKYLAPFQYGIGVRGGMTGLIHATTVLIENNPQHFLLKLDIRNAFNTTSRQQLQQLMQDEDMDPRVRLYFNKVYCRTNRIATRGNVSTTATTGIMQGCPLSPVLFCLAIAPALKKTQEAYPLLNIFAYLDDVKILGPAEDVLGAMKVFDNEIKKLNLHLNVQKSLFYSHEGIQHDRDVLLNAGLIECEESIDILGTPIGQQHQVNDKCIQLANKASEDIYKIIDTLDHHQSSLLLIRHCILPRLNHLARSVPPTHFKSAALEFDKAIRKGLTKICNLDGVTDKPPNPFTSAMRHLPLSKGGLGLTSLSDSHPLMYLASFCESLSSIPTLKDILTNARDQDTSTQHELQQALSKVNSYLPLNTPHYTLNTPGKIGSLQKTYIEALHQHQFNKLKTQLETHAQDSTASEQTKRHSMAQLNILLSQSSIGSMSWLSATPAVKDLTFKNDDFTILLRRATNFNFIPDNLVGHVCECSNPNDPDCIINMLHAENCNKRGQNIDRHNNIRDIFYILAELGNLNPHKEVLMSIGNNYKADLSIKEVYYDFGITSPTQKLCLQLTPSNIKPLYAASYYETTKNNKYRNIMQEANNLHRKYTPIVFESFGAITNNTKTLIKLLAQAVNLEDLKGVTWTAPTKKAHIHQLLQVSMLRDTARSIRASIRHNLAA